MVKSHRLYAAGRKEFQKNAAPATNIQHWTTACKKFYKTLLNPADQIFAAAEFIKTDRLHRALQSHAPVRPALGLAAGISQAPSAHLPRSSPAVHANLPSWIIN